MAVVSDQLRSVLEQRGIHPDELAEACEVDPKTVRRWMGGRVPRTTLQVQVARYLHLDRAVLWPLDQATDGCEHAGLGLVAMYPDRASVPRETWLNLLGEAQQHIDVLVYSGTFFAQTNPRVARMLADRAAQGVRVRLCFGDPNGRAVAIRGQEEGIGDALAAKIRASLSYYRSLLTTDGCEVRLHDTTLYSSLFRYDEDILVNPHVWGQPASANPVFHFREQPGSLAENYRNSFDAVWATARSWTPTPERTAANGHQD